MKNFFIVRAHHSPFSVRHVCLSSPCFVRSLTGVSEDFVDVYVPR